MKEIEKILKKIGNDENFSFLSIENSDKKQKFSLKMEYKYATDFSVLLPADKKKARLIRKKIFFIDSLFKITQNVLGGELTFEFYKKKGSNTIEFSMPQPFSPDDEVWEVSKENIDAEVCLAPWYYQKKFVNLRKRRGSQLSLSSFISFMKSRDFGYEVLEKHLSKTKKSEFTFRDLIEITSESAEMDFSDYIKEKKLKYYEFRKKEIHYFYREKKGEKQTPSLSHLGYAFYPDFPPVPKHEIKKLFPFEILEDRGKLIEIIETNFPFHDNVVDLSEIKIRLQSELSTVISRRNIGNPIGPQSIDLRTNLLNLSKFRGQDKLIHQSTSKGDIIVLEADYSFGKVAVVDESNKDRVLTEKVSIIGKAQDEILLWGLLRSHDIQKQMLMYNDINLKKICYRSAFDNIFLTFTDTQYRHIYKLAFELGCHVSQNIFVNNPIDRFMLGEKFDSLITKQISSYFFAHFIFKQKTHALMRSGNSSNIRKALIIHNRNTEKIAKNIKTFPVKKLYCNIDDTKFSAKYKILDEVASVDIAVICLSLKSIKEIILTKEILQIMGRNHVVIQEGEKNTVVGEIPPPDELLFSHSGNINYCISKKDNVEVGQYISFLLYDPKYYENIFRDLLLQLSTLTSDCFKRVSCSGTSAATKKLTDKDLETFIAMQKDLIRFAYNFSTIRQSSSNIDLRLLEQLEGRFKHNLYLDIDTEWKAFFQKYRIYLSARTLNGYIKNKRDLIEEYKSDLPLLDKIKSTSIEKFKEGVEKSFKSDIQSVYGKKLPQSI